MDRLATLLPARAVACSSRAAASAQQRLRPRRQTFVVHPGIDARLEPRARAAEESGIPQARFLIGVVGRLQADKRQDRVIEAIRILRDRGHDVHGLVVGGNAWNLAPEYEPALRRLVTELGLEEVVTFTGQVPDAIPLIASLDALVNASVTEGCPLVLLEAMALGVPVVATADSGGPAEVIEQARSGILSPSSDPAELANVLEQLLNNVELQRRLSEGAHQRYLERFTAERMARSFEESFEMLPA
jgi:glycosyltransferase involved in cell wall biosynthesis